MTLEAYTISTIPSSGSLRERALEAAGPRDYPDRASDAAILRALFLDVLGTVPRDEQVYGLTARVDGLTFRAKFSPYDESWFLHLVAACPHCGESGTGPALYDIADLGRQLRSFRREFHATCAPRRATGGPS